MQIGHRAAMQRDPTGPEPERCARVPGKFALISSLSLALPTLPISRRTRSISATARGRAWRGYLMRGRSCIPRA